MSGRAKLRLTSDTQLRDIVAPMITCPSVCKPAIRAHYDLSTLFYRLLWGPHIHHGLWLADEPPDAAQRQLIAALADRASIRGGEQVLDVGCGMGGSTISLARQHACDVTAVTLSRVQSVWARCSARWQGVGQRVSVLWQDAESLKLSPDSIDVLWSIECTEHLFDKPAFFRNAARWLRPGGRIAICVWLAGPRDDDDARRQVYEVCEGFLCPSLGTMDDYVDWMTAAGLDITHREDWTTQVLNTWPICRRRVEQTGIRYLAIPFGLNTTRFLDRFDTIDRAYRSQAMQYGCVVARKPV